MREAREALALSEGAVRSGSSPRAVVLPSAPVSLAERFAPRAATEGVSSTSAARSGDRSRAQQGCACY